MNLALINKKLSLGELDLPQMFPHANQLLKAPITFTYDFGLKTLPIEPGILLIRGARQYGKSSWLEQQLVESIIHFGAGCAFYLNGDFIADDHDLHRELENLAASFTQNTNVRRIFIDEITSIKNWEHVLKRLVDNGVLRNILIITTGSSATDLRRGSERLPGRKGKLAQSSFLFTPLSYAHFYEKAHKKLKNKTLAAYLISGGSPIACSELIQHGAIPEYVITLVRDWIEGEIAKSGRQRSALLNILNVIARFGGTAVGQAKLARESGLANNTVAQGYIEILNDLGCIIPAYPIDVIKNQLILRKPCKYHYMNLLVAATFHPSQPRSPDDFLSLPEATRGLWYEWCIAQELQRRQALQNSSVLAPLTFWQSNQHEIDFYTDTKQFIEIKHGKSSPLEFTWFTRTFPKEKLTVINQTEFKTACLEGKTLEHWLLEPSVH